MADIKQREAFRGNSHSPLRQVLHPNPTTTSEQSNESLHTLTDTTATIQRNRRTMLRTPQEIHETETMMALPSSCETALGDNSFPVREVSPVTSSDFEMHHINTATTDPANHRNYQATVKDIPDEGETNSVHSVTTEPSTNPDTSGALNQR